MLATTEVRLSCCGRFCSRQRSCLPLAIMEELGLQRHEYGSMLLVLGGLDQDQGRYKEALAIYDKAKAVLVQYKEVSEYGVLVNEMPCTLRRFSTASLKQATASFHWCRHRALCDFKTALPLVQRGVVLEQQLAGPAFTGARPGVAGPVRGTARAEGLCCSQQGHQGGTVPHGRTGPATRSTDRC
jgi:hypothetical protein